MLVIIILTTLIPFASVLELFAFDQLCMFANSETLLVSFFPSFLTNSLKDGGCLSLLHLLKILECNWNQQGY